MMESRCGVGKVWICILMQIGPAKIEGADQRCWFCCVDEVHDVCIINVESKFFCWRRVREAFCARAVFVITSVFGWLDVCKATYESKHDEVPLIKMNNCSGGIVQCDRWERTCQTCYSCRVPFRSWVRIQFLGRSVYCEWKATLQTFLLGHGVFSFLSIQLLSFRCDDLVIVE